VKKIQVFTEKEENLIHNIKTMMRQTHKNEEYNMVSETQSSLIILADSISRYPSIFGIQHLGQNERSIDTLVENLCNHREIDFVLNTPTKAVLGRSFTVAKINFFLMLEYICRSSNGLCSMDHDIKFMVTHNVFSLMAEDVFTSIISDETLDIGERKEAAYLLARIWEFRIYKGVEEFAPILVNLWKSHIDFIPAYGTMAGISEITSFCLKSHPQWLSFIQDEDFTDDTLKSLLEYLMGLSHEEIEKIKYYMEKNSIKTLTREQIDEILSSRKTYKVNDYYDPREMYNFYIKRRENANFRKKSKIPGPQKTIEEYVMCYMLKKGIITKNGNTE